jgi:hypothetical protein
MYPSAATDSAAPSSPAQLEAAKSIARSALSSTVSGISTGAALINKAAPAVSSYLWGTWDNLNGHGSRSTNAAQSSHPATTAVVGAVAGAATGTAAVVGAVPVVHAIGFTATGISTGSAAAGMMSSAATAAGGAISSGSAVSVLQSIGALSAVPGGVIVPVALGAAAVGMAIPAVSNYILGGSPTTSVMPESSSSGVLRRSMEQSSMQAGVLRGVLPRRGSSKL